jgi:hypothetical protein
MNRLALLIPLVLACSSRPLGTHALDGGLSGGGTTGSGGAMVSGGVTGAGGSTSASGGVASSGGIRAAGGMNGTGGSISASGGSTSTADLDACSSDSDCTESCTWITAPTDSSQCNAQWCCGQPFVSKKRCEANQAAWAAYCPNRSPTDMHCPCAISMCEIHGGTITQGCIGGKCDVLCVPSVGGAGGSTVIPLGSGGYSGNDGTGGMGGANTGSGSIGGMGGTAGSSAETSPDAGCVTPTAGTVCSATSVVCGPNGCCNPNNFVCVNGEWVDEPLCLCP